MKWNWCAYYTTCFCICQPLFWIFFWNLKNFFRLPSFSCIFGGIFASFWHLPSFFDDYLCIYAHILCIKICPKQGVFLCAFWTQRGLFIAVLIKGWAFFCSPFINIMHKGDTLVPFVSHGKCHKTGNARHFFLQNKNCIQNYSIPCAKYGDPSKIKDFRPRTPVRIYNIKEGFYARQSRDDIQTEGLMIYECISRHRRVIHSVICTLKRDAYRLRYLASFVVFGRRIANMPLLRNG